MKKFLSVMLIVLLALCVFVSCDDDDEDSSTTSYFTLNSKSYSTLQEVVDAASSGKGTPVSASTNVIGLTGDYTGPGAIISGLTGYSINFGDYNFKFTSDIVIKNETKLSIIGKLESSKSSVGIVLEDSTVTIDGSSEIDSNIKITGATLDVNDSATLSVDYFEVYGSKVKFNTTGETEIAKIYAPTGTNEIEVAGSGKFEIEKNEGSVSYDVINSGDNTNVTIPSADGTTQIEVTTGTISSYSNGVKEENVENIAAAIGAKGYETLAEAVNAAKEGETIKLFNNHTSTDEALVFDESGVVLDLNGKTLSLERTGSTKNIQINSDVTIKNGKIKATLTSDSNSAIYGLTGAKLTLEDVDITAKDGNNNMAYAVALLASGTKEAPVSLTIDGGTFDGYVGTNGLYRYQNITIEDGTFNGDVYFPGYGAYVIKGGTFNSLVEIKSGTLEISGGEFKNNDNDNISFIVNNNGTTMTGVSLGAVAYAGTIDGKGYGPTPEITINGGTFAGSIGLASQNEKGTLPTVTYGDDFDDVDTVIFVGSEVSLSSAIASSKENDTIKFYSDISSADEALVFDKSGVVLDLNGKTLSLTRTGSTKNIQINSDVTIKNGSIEATLTSGSNSAIYGLAGAKLTLEDVDITAKDGNNNMAYAVALLASGTKEAPVSLTIDGGTFDGYVGTNGLYRYQNITIEDGTFNGDVYFPGYGAYVIKGGTFNSLVEIKSGTLEISGGEFKNNDNDNISFIVNNNGTTMTGVSLGAVAYAGTIDGKGYGPTPAITITGGTFAGSIGLASQVADGTLPTLNVSKNVNAKTTIFVGSKTALDYVIGNIETSKIVLYNDITYTGRVYIPTGKTVDLDLNGHLLYSTNDVAITNAGTLTIRDDSTGKKGEVRAQEFCVGLLTGNATCTIESGNFTAIDNAVLGTNGSTGRGGNTITINGGTFTGGITSSGYVACGIYAPNDDTWTINGGTFNITGGAGIVARAGVVTVNDGTFNCSGNTTGKVGDSRVVVPCSALVFDESANYPGLTDNSKIIVNGGSFNTTNGVDAFTLVPNTATSRIEDNRNNG